MNDTSKPLHRSQIEVRGYELDSFGHVNHAVYVQYFEHARWKMLADHGITLESFNAAQAWPIIAEIQVRYLKPTYLGEVLEVRSNVSNKGRTHFEVTQELFRGLDCVASGKVQIVMVNSAGRPTEMPEIVKKMVSA